MKNQNLISKHENKNWVYKIQKEGVHYFQNTKDQYLWKVVAQKEMGPLRGCTVVTYGYKLPEKEVVRFRWLVELPKVKEAATDGKKYTSPINKSMI